MRLGFILPEPLHWTPPEATRRLRSRLELVIYRLIRETLQRFQTDYGRSIGRCDRFIDRHAEYEIIIQGATNITEAQTVYQGRYGVWLLSLEKTGGRLSLPTRIERVPYTVSATPPDLTFHLATFAGGLRAVVSQQDEFPLATCWDNLHPYPWQKTFLDMNEFNAWVRSFDSHSSTSQ